MYTNSSSTLLCLTFTRMAFSAPNENQIIKEKLKLCYLREGVNHLENCSELATAYMDSLRGTGIYKIHNAHHARDVVKVRRKPQTLSYQLHHTTKTNLYPHHVHPTTERRTTLKRAVFSYRFFFEYSNTVTEKKQTEKPLSKPSKSTRDGDALGTGPSGAIFLSRYTTWRKVRRKRERSLGLSDIPFHDGSP